jgi:hypothetical protein
LADQPGRLNTKELSSDATLRDQQDDHQRLHSHRGRRRTPVVSALNSQALPPAVGVTIGAIVAIAGAVVHWATPNTTTDPQVAATQSVKLKTVHKVNTPPAAGP